jgi:hypothetical protein
MISQADLHWSLVLKLMTFELQGMVVSVHIPKYLPKGCGDCSPLLENDNEVKEREREDSHDFSS